MKIQEQDIYHGAALTQIVEHQSFKALNRCHDKYGHYSVNNDTRLFIKYRTSESSPWQFNFQPAELNSIIKDISLQIKVIIVLVCGKQTICAIDTEQLHNLINFKSKKPQYILVECREKGSMWLSGSAGSLSRSVPHNSFPNKVF